MNFGLLGPVEVWLDGRPLPAGHARQRAVLAVLLMEVGQVVPLETLIDRVWGEDPPRSVRSAVYGYVARLRALIASGDAPDAALSRRAGGYLLQAVPDQVDMCRFRRLVAAAAAKDDEPTAKLLGEAVGLWRGNALAGLDSPWLNGMRVRLELERTAAVRDLTDLRLRRGEHAALASELAGQAVAEPADERLIGQLMLALYRRGRQAEALAWFEHTRQYLDAELGANPTPELRALHEQILRADLALAPPARDRREEVLVATDAPGSGRAAAPHHLPATVSQFTGRAAELEALSQMLDHAGAGAPGTVVISAIDGTAGVGKTALALRWAHQVAGRFGDGQLHMNLRGFDPSGTPATVAETMRAFLDTLGVPPGRIPASLEAQAGLYRNLLADKRMLILLDNARDEQQVRPLLPASPGSLVIVTSRSQLPGLVAAEGARMLTLDVLSHAEAVQLVTARLGTSRAAAEPIAVDRIASLCACLPLALAVAAARAAARPRLPLATLAGELADSVGRLDALDSGDPAASVRAVFSWSTCQLTGEAARMFRLLGLHPGPDISVPAAASLAGRTQPQARRLLRDLALAHLITEHVPGRYAFHDLLRAYAAEQARAHDSEPERACAIGRVLDHYLHTAAAAAVPLNPAAEPVVLAPPRTGAIAGYPADSAAALAWFEAEHPVLLAAVTFAVESGFDIYTWQLPWAMAPFLQIRGHWQEWASAQRTALAAATRLRDTAAQALSGRLLASACFALGDLDQARSHLVSSLTLYQRLGNRLGEAKTHEGLGVLAEHQGAYADALEHAEKALLLSQAVGDKGNEAIMLNAVGWSHGLVGEYQQARVFCRQAITLFAETGNRRLEGAAWDSVGYAEHHLGNHAEAAACYQRALSLYREVADRFFEADVLTHLGDARHAADELTQAGEAWHQALTILEDIQHPDADLVRAKLASLDATFAAELADSGDRLDALDADEVSASRLDVAGIAGLVPRQLPAAISHFAGRAVELAALGGQVARAGDGGATVVISAIAGTAGVGKSGLALHWAHQVADQFPDGQLYVDLRGYDPQPPLSAADALAGFLRALGLPGRDIPAEVGERAARYRSLLAGRRVLIVLDNARDASQVRPLLPGAGGCVTVVTSRDSLAGLVARDGARRIELDLLPVEDAVGLLRALIGGRVDEDPGAAGVLAQSCCRLPLALRVAAELAATRPAVPLAHLAAELGDQQRRLDLLDAAGDPATAVRAVLSWSYRHLDPGTARAFALLGLHPGPGIDTHAAAALFATTLTETAGLLDRLARAHLIQPGATGRYGMHDLLRRYAADLAVQTMTRGQRQEATARLLDYLQCTAGRAESVQQTRSTAIARYCGSGRAAPDFADRGQAMEWLRAERPVLLACLDNVTADGQHARVVAVTAGLAGLLRVDGPWTQARSRHAAAVHAACELGDRLGEADAMLCLGEAQQLVHDPAFEKTLAQAAGIFGELGDRLGLANALRIMGTGQLMASNSVATETLATALDVFRDLDDRPGLASTLTYLAEVQRQRGRRTDAVTLVTEARDIFSALGDRAGYAEALIVLGMAQCETEGYPVAAQSLSTSLSIGRDLGSPRGQAYALGILAQVEFVLGDYEAANRHITDALKINGDLGEKYGEAYVLRSLGEVRCATGDYQGAERCLAEALAIFRDLGSSLGRAHVLAVLGDLWTRTADYPAAEKALAEALAIFDERGTVAFAADLLNKTGALRLARGEVTGAADSYQQALDLARRLGEPSDEGSALAGLARCAVTDRDDATAVTFFQQAHAILTRIGAAEAHQIAAELQSRRALPA